MRTERELIGCCLALVSRNAKLSAGERALAQADPVSPSAHSLEVVRRSILRGEDPLGDAFTAARTPLERRGAGAVYTPLPIVRSMVEWLARQSRPTRIIDPGAGSGRFVFAAGEAFPDARLIAVESDPLAALMVRAGLSVRGWDGRAEVKVSDYRAVALPLCEGPTAFVGNPPYVRHHDIEADWKAWYVANFARLGIKASALAGLHLHFFLQTRLLAKPGDFGAFVTSAEWLDVNYGSALRRLLVDGLGGSALHALEPTVEAFPGTATTAAIACFKLGEIAESVKLRAVAEVGGLGGLSGGEDVSRARLRATPRWTTFLRPSREVDAGTLALGDLFRVHRGQVTGANGVWVAGDEARALPDRVKLPAVTKAKDLMRAGSDLRTSDGLRRVVDLPAELDGFDRRERAAVDAFLEWAKALGADRSYVARARRAWWSVGLRAPAPILCTYMARRPPQFTLNACEARHINIAHGLYPRRAMTEGALRSMVDWLNANVSIANGRAYSGGLVKFEPKEVERLRVPRLELVGA